MVWGTTSRQSRGYDAAWERVRKVVLARDGGLCQACRRAGTLGVIGRDVDHIISRDKAKSMGWSKDRTEHPGNLELLCVTCHKKKTLEETGKTFRAKQRIGEDGFPVEI